MDWRTILGFCFSRNRHITECTRWVSPEGGRAADLNVDEINEVVPLTEQLGLWAARGPKRPFLPFSPFASSKEKTNRSPGELRTQ